VADSPSARLAERGIHLPPPPAPRGTYVPVVIEGAMAYVSGQIVLDGAGVAHPGLVDRDVSFETARDLARRSALQGLSALDVALGSLDKIRRVLKVTVFVASAPGFVRQHEVANGATDVLVEVFGEAGRPARSSVGVAALPLNAPVEVELVVAVG
jgi:enamine deaminase RidA (YjgF/YER057c/UK114 family)